MKEIRTCEEYVLAELENRKEVIKELSESLEEKCNECDGLIDRNDKLEKELEDLKADIEFLKKFFSLNGYKGSVKFDDDALYPWHEDSGFDRFVSILGLKKDESESESK